MLLKGEVLLPDLAVVDYRFSLSSPPSVTAATGLDALTHAVEAYTSIQAQPLSDVYTRSAVRRILRGFRRPGWTAAAGGSEGNGSGGSGGRYLY